MDIKYDQLADAVYVKLTDEKIARTQKNSETVVVDFDAKGDVAGIEILDVSSQQELLSRLQNNVQTGIPVSIENATPVTA